LAKPAFVGYEPRDRGLNPNCGNCKNWIGKSRVRKELDELYEMSPQFKSDREEKSDRGRSFDTR